MNRDPMVDDDRDRVSLEDDHLRGTWALGPDGGEVCEEPVDWDLEDAMDDERKRQRRNRVGWWTH